MLKEITEKEYKELKKDKGLYVLVFHALWCPPCRMFKESLQELADKDNVNVYRVNVENEKELAKEMNVSNLPAWFVFKDQKPVLEKQGYLPYEELKKVIESVK